VEEHESVRWVLSSGARRQTPLLSEERGSDPGTTYVMAFTFSLHPLPGNTLVIKESDKMQSYVDQIGNSKVRFQSLARESGEFRQRNDCSYLLLRNSFYL